MLRLFVALWLLFIAYCPALCQGVSVDPPVAGRPENFSNIVGTYKISATAEPVDVRVEESITLHIWITGKGPERYAPKRKYLRLFPDSWERDFYILPLPDEDGVNREKEGSWHFAFRLKPKHEKIDTIDGITLWTYNPDRPGKTKYVADFAPAITIKVRPKTDQADGLTIDVPAVPASFYEIANGSEVLALPSSVVISQGHLIVLLVVPPFLCFLGAVIWRRYSADETRLRREIRERAAQRAQTCLAADGRAWDAVRQYLAERFDFRPVDPTPTDISEFLRRRGFAKSLYQKAHTFFQACDAIRFACLESRRDLAQDASQLIQSLEADPCARG